MSYLSSVSRNAARFVTLNTPCETLARPPGRRACEAGSRLGAGRRAGSRPQPRGAPPRARPCAVLRPRPAWLLSVNPPLRRGGGAGRAHLVPRLLVLLYPGSEAFYSESLERRLAVKPISQKKIETQRVRNSQGGEPVPSISQGRPRTREAQPIPVLPVLYPRSAYPASRCKVLPTLHSTALLNASWWTSEACVHSVSTLLHYRWIPREGATCLTLAPTFKKQ